MRVARCRMRAGDEVGQRARGKPWSADEIKQSWPQRPSSRSRREDDDAQSNRAARVRSILGNFNGCATNLLVDARNAARCADLRERHFRGEAASDRNPDCAFHEFILPIGGSGHKLLTFGADTIRVPSGYFSDP